MKVKRNKTFSVKERVNYIKKDTFIPIKAATGAVIGTGLLGLGSGNIKMAGLGAVAGALAGEAKGIYDANKNYNMSKEISRKYQESSDNKLSPELEKLSDNPPKEYKKLGEIIFSDEHKRMYKNIEDIYSKYDYDMPSIFIRDIDGESEITNGKVNLISVGSGLLYDIYYNLQNRTWSSNNHNIPNLKSFIIETLTKLGSDDNLDFLDGIERSKVQKYTDYLVRQLKQKL